MIAMAFRNKDQFIGWSCLRNLSVDDSELQPMYNWCDETFGSENVAVVRFGAHNFLGRTDRKWHKRISLRLYFKNEADLAFFQMKFSNGILSRG